MNRPAQSGSPPPTLQKAFRPSGRAGHLVFIQGTGQTLQQSDKVIPLDQPFDYGAAVCAALTDQVTGP